MYIHSTTSISRHSFLLWIHDLLLCSTPFKVAPLNSNLKCLFALSNSNMRGIHALKSWTQLAVRNKMESLPPLIEMPWKSCNKRIAKVAIFGNLQTFCIGRSFFCHFFDHPICRSPFLRVPAPLYAAPLNAALCLLLHYAPLQCVIFQNMPFHFVALQCVIFRLMPFHFPPLQWVIFR